MRSKVGDIQSLKGFKAIEAIEEFLYLFGTYLSEGLNAEEAFLTASQRLESPFKSVFKECTTLLLEKALPLHSILELMALRFNSLDLRRYLEFLAKTIRQDPQKVGPTVLQSLSTLQKNRKIYETRQQLYRTLFLKMYLITSVLAVVMGVIEGLSPLLDLLGSPFLSVDLILTPYAFSLAPFWPTLFGGFIIVTYISYKNTKLFKLKYTPAHALILGSIYLIVCFGVSMLFFSYL